MSTTKQIRMEIDERGMGSLLVNGEDVSNAVNEVTIRAYVGQRNEVIWGNKAAVMHTEIGTPVSVFVQSRASLRPTDEALLVALGWSPADGDELALVLRLIEAHDSDYEIRYPLVFRALSLALAAGYAAGIRIDPAEPDWPVVYIELPTGQASWHMPPHPLEFDGHTTAEKYERIRAFTDPASVDDQELPR